jgi:hypothetical protein
MLVVVTTDPVLGSVVFDLIRRHEADDRDAGEVDDNLRPTVRMDEQRCDQPPPLARCQRRRNVLQRAQHRSVDQNDCAS